MPVSPSYRTFVLEQLGRVAPGIRARSMFGGVGIYSDALFFALMDKVDDTNRPDYVAVGMGPFRPFGPDGEVMQYYQVPEELLEDVETLELWVGKAVEVARRRKRA
ncbi:MAG TPA: TfoX/Sxy family protein [Gemmatimonadales bacterium]|nr:TfoX/Sxy family protein [Gemmatimonadales bacterium]